VRACTTNTKGPTPLFGLTNVKSVGKMRLNALLERGRVVDFIWVFANDAAARLVRCDPQFLLGKGLREIVAGSLAHPALIERYRRVFELGGTQFFEQVHVVDGRQDIVIHRVQRVSEGVEITLTNRSAVRRSRAASRELPPSVAQGLWG
jgi:PAS domain-containing protein